MGVAEPMPSYRIGTVWRRCDRVHTKLNHSSWQTTTLWAPGSSSAGRGGRYRGGGGIAGHGLSPRCRVQGAGCNQPHQLHSGKLRNARRQLLPSRRTGDWGGSRAVGDGLGPSPPRKLVLLLSGTLPHPAHRFSGLHPSGQLEVRLPLKGLSLTSGTLDSGTQEPCMAVPARGTVFVRHLLRTTCHSVIPAPVAPATR